MNQEDLNEHLKFIDEYAHAKNPAAGSLYDSNANVTSLNIATLQTEVSKKDLIDINRALTTKYISKLYGDDMAKQYLADLHHHIIYRHDETSLMPYTYSAKEVVNVKYKDKILLISFEDLYNLVEDKETNIKEGVWAKYPTGLVILDKNGYVPVSRLIRKDRHRPLVRVKTSYGEDLVVTDNHPLIVEDNVEATVPAIEGKGHKQFKPDFKLQWNNNNSINSKEFISSSLIKEDYNDWYSIQTKEKCNLQLVPTKIQLTQELGYFVGYFIGDGNYNHDAEGNLTANITITQKEDEDLKVLGSIAAKYFNAPSAIYKEQGAGLEKNQLVIHSTGLVYFLNSYCNIKHGAPYKTLPTNILDTNKDFGFGIIEGLIDSDGTINKDGSGYIRLSSRTCIEQLTWLLPELGYTVGNTVQAMAFSTNAKIKQKYTIWGINFNQKDSTIGIKYSTKLSKAIRKTKALKYKKGWVNIDSISEIEPSSFLDDNKYIYDITTDTHSFICNNIWVHNCVSVSLYPFLLNGLKDLGGSASAPTHADSYIGGLCNLIFLVAGQFAGACLYKNQHLLVNNNGISNSIKAKDFISSFDLDKHYNNYQGEWDYKDISDDGYYVEEDGKQVKINKVMRRLYKNKIYTITTLDGHKATTSKDHIFKVLYGGRQIEVKAENLKLYDTVFMNKDISSILNKDSHDYKYGFITGAICGDGCITKDKTVRLSVCPTQTYVADIFNAFTQELFGFKLNSTKISNGCFDYRKYGTEVYNFITKYIIGKDTYTKHLDNIENKSLDFLAGFLDGMFITDGSYSANRGVHIQLTNKQLVENIETILDKFNIIYNHHRTVAPKGNKKEAYSLYVPTSILPLIKYTPLKKLGLGEIKKSKYKYCYGSSAFKLRSDAKTHLWSDSNQNNNYKTDIITNIETFDNDDGYVYEIETESHYYNCGGFITHNCAIPEFLTYFDHFIRKDFGDDYINHLDEDIYAFGTRHTTLRKKIEDWFQQFVYTINQPAAARNYQSPFTNIAYFDKYYFASIFKDFVFPDGDEPKWDTTKELQKMFMKWFNAERNKAILTFPVETFNILCSAKDEIEVELEDGTILNFLPEQEIKVKYNNDIVYILAKDLVDNFDKYEIIKDN